MTTPATPAPPVRSSALTDTLVIERHNVLVFIQKLIDNCSFQFQFHLERPLEDLDQGCQAWEAWEGWEAWVRLAIFLTVTSVTSKINFTCITSKKSLINNAMNSSQNCDFCASMGQIRMLDAPFHM